ncbi:hypothetical protein KKG58_02330 [Patescibacteria group bacterium]|nr:hypothetical protein [Patescibacteria group bacterium]
MKDKLLPLKNLFWFTNFKNLDLEENKNLIVHQTLALGDWGQTEYLFKLYSKPEIKKEFIKLRKGLYEPKILGLSKLFLGIKKLSNEKQYIKNIYDRK